MRRTLLVALACLAASAGCAVIKTTDVTDAGSKRYQSIAVLGWPIYSRVSDQTPGHYSPARLAIKEDGANRSRELEPAEFLETPLKVPADIGEER